uniref:LysE family translocator n=1 Tax=Thermoanaerobaculum aquaticum TaxID=1312852 RepID=A0A7C2N9N9_9BACT
MTNLTLPLSLPALVITGFLVSFATVVIPGPITLVATRLGLAHRLGAAFWFLLGATLLDGLLFAALAAGAGPSLARLGALPAVEIAGGLVLLWGGLSSARHRPTREPQPNWTSNSRPRFRYLLLGMGVSLANPHYWLWWVTAGLAFVEAARTYGEPGLLWMLGALIGGVVCWYAPLLYALHHGKTLLSPKSEALVVRVLAVVLVILGLGLVGLGGYRLGLRWGLPG